MTVRLCIFILLFAALAHGQTVSLQAIETRYYVVKTDITNDEAREASLRMTKMAEEYAARTRDFSGAIRTRFPLYLVHDDDAYLKLGGISGSAGLFNGEALVVHVPDHVNARVWHVMQHEGFHQFAAAVIGGQRPVWVNEGLAEYFGEAVYTGDGFIAGIIPQWRLARLRKEFETNQFKSIEQMMEMSLDEWNSKLSIVNYDQGWSMVHFLVHGDGGKYRAAFSSFMIDLSHNRPWQRAWQDNFGEATGFEQRWRDWWKRLPDDPTADLYARATVVTLTSFIARAASQKQTFASFDDFSRSARSGKLSIAPDQWLPDSLLRDALEQCDKLSEGGAALSLASTRLTCRLKSGITLTGRFTLRNGSIIIDVDQR